MPTDAIPFDEAYNNVGIAQGTTSASASIPSLATVYNSVSDPTATQSLTAGYITGDISSANFQTGVAGWKLSYTGDFEGNSGTFRGALTGNTITGATIIGGTIETASGTGTRLVLYGADNTLTFYNSSNAIVTQLGGGAFVGTALRITTDATTTEGVSVSSTISGSTGFRYVNDSNVLNNGIVLQMNGTTNNTNPSLQITKNGDGESIALFNNGTGRGIGLYNTSNAPAIYLTNSGQGNSISIDHVATGANITGIDMTVQATNHIATGIKLDVTAASSSNPTAIYIATSAASGRACYAFDFEGSERISATTNTAAINGKIKILMNGVTSFIYTYDG